MNMKRGAPVMKEIIDIEKIVSSMTLDEKVHFVVGVGMLDHNDNPKGKVYGSAGETLEIKRLGLPNSVLADGPAGLRIYPEREGDDRTYYTTAFPVETMIASTWNREILWKVGEAMGEEVKEYGVDILLAPAVNIHRNPLCGRNFEYYSEDPLLSGEMAANFVMGLQAKGVGACVKHFVANEQETNRMTIDTIVSERALREIYLKPFEIVIKKARPWTIMSSYNKLKGYYTSENKWLLTNILREELGFEGFVMTDWFAGSNGAKQILAGNDLIMPGKSYQFLPHRTDETEDIFKALESGELSEKILDERIKKILSVLVKTPSYNSYSYSNSPDLKKHAEVSYEAGCEGVVLLKNNYALPISKDTPFVVFGTGQIETVRGGTGSGETHPEYTINLIDGINERNLNIDKEIVEFYSSKVKEFREGDYKISYGSWNEEIKPKLPENLFDRDDYEKISRRNDVAFIVISRISGEGKDRSLEKGDYYLTDDEKEMLRTVSEVFRSKGKKTVAVLNIGGPIEMESWKDYCDAILVLWQPGQEAGRIFADVIRGVVNPSGKLPTTFPRNYDDIPSKSFPGEPAENPVRVVYDEGIYVGYRYYDTFRVQPVYEFGFGLSYTEFEYSDLNLKKNGEKIVLSFKVKNTGNFAGKEVAQVYVKAPRVKIDKPYQELKAFEKTNLLAPGEEQRISIEIQYPELASYDGYNWVVEEGEYEFRIGSSSRDIRLVGKISL
ncbi:beta-glucosidase [Kosmotoga arenicorallina]|uniref:beta-glucosidase n=1 Tax=Kosmotoga arenicorallina TaxID=688066 RepID=UPI000AFB0A53|nr:beta-glucosidase [Kosmotoga arenicorallina]